MSISKKSSAGRRPRAAGRPEQRHSVGAEAILDAALQLLKTTSPEKITVVEVAARAHVDPALVRYYFGDKKGMLHAAGKRLLDQVQEVGAARLHEPGTLEQRVRRRLEMLIQALENHPRFMQLVINEVYTVGADSAPDAQRDLETVAGRGLTLTRALLQACDGPAPREVDARYLHVAILGLCTFFMEARPLLDVLFRSEGEAARGTSAYVDFATDLLTRGLLSRAGEDAPAVAAKPSRAKKKAA